MDKDKDILKDFFKGKLQNYAPPVKRDIWSSMESHIPAEKSLWRRIYPVVASAAAILLIAILSYKYVFNESPDLENPVVLVVESQEQGVTEIGNSEETKELLPEANADELQVYVPKVQQKTERTPEKDLFAFKEDSIKQEALIEESTQVASIAHQEKEETLDISETETKTKQQLSEENTKNPPRDVARDRSFENGNNYYTVKTKSSSSGVQASLSGQGFFTNANELDFLKIYNKEYLSSYKNKFEIEELFSPGEPTGGDPSSTAPWLPADDYTLSNIKYHTPVTLSMYVSKNISSRWAIETGISYTMLSSEETWIAENENFYKKVILYNDIKLHYLGIPLKASYFLIKKDRLFMYLSGGGMIEKNISGKAYTVSDDEKTEKHTKIKIRELQYSVTGGVGIGVKLFRPVSLFVEPGMTYYFDDGSDIMTIRKDKPFNFNIQGGLKFYF
jgi:hypothetical protein